MKGADVDSRELTEWDSGLLIFLKPLSEFSAQKKITIEESGLPEGARKLLPPAIFFLIALNLILLLFPARVGSITSSEGFDFLSRKAIAVIPFESIQEGLLAVGSTRIDAFVSNTTLVDRY